MSRYIAMNRLIHKFLIHSLYSYKRYLLICGRHVFGLLPKPITHACEVALSLYLMHLLTETFCQLLRETC